MPPTLLGRHGPLYVSTSAERLDAVKTVVDDYLSRVVNSLDVVDAIDFTDWLLGRAHRLAGISNDNGSKAT